MRNSGGGSTYQGNPVLEASTLLQYNINYIKIDFFKSKRGCSKEKIILIIILIKKKIKKK
jgi:hypothetical protein